MDRKELKAYVKHVYELEVSVYQQKQLEEKIENEITQLPQKPDEVFLLPFLKGVMRWILGITLLLCLVFMCLAATHYSWARQQGYHPDDFYMFCIPGILILGAALYLWAGCNYSDANNQYRKQLDAYTKAQPFKNTLQAELSAVQTKLTETEAMLTEFYNIPDEDDDCFIHKDYRELISVSYFYQLLDHKQASTLPDCYDRFDTAVYRHNVLTKMDDIRRDLNQIRISQVMLYQAITHSNQINENLYTELVSLNEKGERLNQQMDDICKSNRLMAHNSELARQEAEYRRFLEEFRNT